MGLHEVLRFSVNDALLLALRADLELVVVIFSM